MSRSRDFGAAASSLAAPSSANNGYNYVVDTTQASGWNVSPYNNFNYFVNGAMDYWQRGVSTTTTDVFLADKWVGVSCSSYQRSTDVPSGQGFTYSAQFGSNTATYPRLAYRFGTDEGTFLAGKTVTISFWAKNVSGTGILYCEQQYPTTPNSFNPTYNVVGAGGGTAFASSNDSWQTSPVWKKFSYTTTITSFAATNGFLWQLVRDNSSASTTLATGFKMELGSVATPFTRNGGDLAGEFLKCQRYYEKSYPHDVAPQTNTTQGIVQCADQAATTTTTQGVQVLFKVAKRITPTVTLYRRDGSVTNPNYWQYYNGTTGTYAASTVDSGSKSVNGFLPYFNGTASGLTVNNAYTVLGHWVADAENN